jgi:hypothetical protein
MVPYSRPVCVSSNPTNNEESRRKTRIYWWQILVIYT